MKILNRQLNILKQQPLGEVVGELLQVMREIKDIKRGIYND